MGAGAPGVRLHPHRYQPGPPLGGAINPKEDGAGGDARNILLQPPYSSYKREGGAPLITHYTSEQEKKSYIPTLAF